MRSSLRAVGAVTLAIALAACGGTGTATTAPALTTAGTTCHDSTGTTVVATGVSDNTWDSPVNGKVGDVITWTNGDGVPHRVATDDGTCKMGANIPTGGGTASLVFDVAGTYAFHCAIHSSMHGTIVIS